MSKRAFTLVELLVVISIISLLSSVILSSLQQARIKARNTSRNQQVMEYAKALALFKANAVNDAFPLSDGGSYVCLGGAAGYTCGDSDNPASYSSNVAGNLQNFMRSYPPIGSGFVAEYWIGALYYSLGDIALIEYVLDGNKTPCVRPPNTKQLNQGVYVNPMGGATQSFRCSLLLD